ncbi:unnamed protein product [Cylicocyclus nassatus]|uniref:Uncharacterized protein n=1 Tax=Cylicocyclus nassatus TaxID=53992 RepID=A0AA36DNH0_CYLNA|nr:unnamed protein product [Cylicocyclus nassatus]
MYFKSAQKMEAKQQLKVGMLGTMPSRAMPSHQLKFEPQKYERPLLTMNVALLDQSAMDGSLRHGQKAPSESTMVEKPTMDYVNRPEGEMDMMIGFFLMNGVCVAFFLLFGLCVIFSCLRQRPKIFRKQRTVRKQAAVPAPPAPKFKTLVSQAIRTGKMDKLKTVVEDVEDSAEKKEIEARHDGNSVNVHLVPPKAERKSMNRESQQLESQQSVIEVESEAEVYPKTSVIRQNLLINRRRSPFSSALFTV